MFRQRKTDGVLKNSLSVISSIDYTCCIMQTRVTSWRGPSARYCFCQLNFELISLRLGDKPSENTTSNVTTPKFKTKVSLFSVVLVPVVMKRIYYTPGLEF